jgi:hypothetical protein
LDSLPEVEKEDFVIVNLIFLFIKFPQSRSIPLNSQTDIVKDLVDELCVKFRFAERFLSFFERKETLFVGEEEPQFRGVLQEMVGETFPQKNCQLLSSGLCKLDSLFVDSG